MPARALTRRPPEITVPRLVAELRSDILQAHASATERLLRDPNVGLERAVQEAKRLFALGRDKEA
jgi:hypothetical protein